MFGKFFYTRLLIDTLQQVRHHACFVKIFYSSLLSSQMKQRRCEENPTETADLGLIRMNFVDEIRLNMRVNVIGSFCTLAIIKGCARLCNRFLVTFIFSIFH